MRRSALFAFIPLLAASRPAQSAVPLSPAAQHDVQCFMLYSIAVDTAVTAKDDKTQAAASLGVMYFVGKLAVEAPGLDLASAVRQEADGMDANPHVKEIGVACDTEFAKRAEELRDIGRQSLTPASQSSSSS
jgi:hypothetical protein